MKSNELNFVPCSIEALARTVPSKAKSRFAVIGKGYLKTKVKSKKRPFFILRGRKETGEVYQFPVFVPEGTVMADAMILKTENRKPVFFMRFKAKLGLAGCPLVSWKSGSLFPCRQYAKYEKVDGKWTVTESDGINLLSG